MGQRTVEMSSFDEYLACEDDSPAERAEATADRTERLTRFPHSVMLKLSFAELDFAARWCWQNFGPCDGKCWQHESRYRVCDRGEPHSHSGKWTEHWFVKTEYNFGFCEWYFAESADRDRFLANIENIHWGEDFEKPFLA